MLVCRACNTRFDAGQSACPSCGRRSTDHAVDAGSSGSQLPLRAAPAATDDEEEIDLELEDAVSKAPPRPREPRPESRPPRRTRAPAAAPAASADAGQVRAALAEQPGLLEPGLGLHADEDGEPLGIDFPTPVGSIDLLGRDRKGSYVVVHVPSPDEVEDSVSGMLRRMGWVRKHLADEREEVRGIVVIDRLPEELSYAVAGVEGRIAFKGYRLSLTFHDLDV